MGSTPWQSCQSPPPAGFVSALRRRPQGNLSFQFSFNKSNRTRYARPTHDSGPITESWFNRFGSLLRTAENGATHQGNLTTQTNPLRRATRREYNAKGNLLPQVNPESS